jgi:hypothetical protein
MLGSSLSHQIYLTFNRQKIPHILDHCFTLMRERERERERERGREGDRE